MVMDNSKIKKK